MYIPIGIFNSVLLWVLSMSSFQNKLIKILIITQPMLHTIPNQMFGLIKYMRFVKILCYKIQITYEHN